MKLPFIIPSNYPHFQTFSHLAPCLDNKRRSCWSFPPNFHKGSSSRVTVSFKGKGKRRSFAWLFLSVLKVTKANLARLHPLGNVGESQFPPIVVCLPSQMSELFHMKPSEKIVVGVNLVSLSTKCTKLDNELYLSGKKST